MKSHTCENNGRSNTRLNKISFLWFARDFLKLAQPNVHLGGLYLFWLPLFLLTGN